MCNTMSWAKPHQASIKLRNCTSPLLLLRSNPLLTLRLLLRSTPLLSLRRDQQSDAQRDVMLPLGRLNTQEPRSHRRAEPHNLFLVRLRGTARPQLGSIVHSSILISVIGPGHAECGHELGTMIACLATLDSQTQHWRHLASVDDHPLIGVVVLSAPGLRRIQARLRVASAHRVAIPHRAVRARMLGRVQCEFYYDEGGHIAHNYITISIRRRQCI